MNKKNVKAIKLSMYNREIAFSDNVLIKFDKNGIGEVDENKYENLLKVYSEFVADENYLPVPDASGESLTEEEKLEIIKYKEIAAKANQKAEFYKQKQKTAEEDVKIWKDKVNTLIEDGKNSSNGSKQLKEEIKSLKKTNQELTFRVELWKSSLPKLRDQAIEMTKNKRLKNEKDKGKIIDVIVKNV